MRVRFLRTALFGQQEPDRLYLNDAYLTLFDITRKNMATQTDEHDQEEAHEAAARLGAAPRCAHSPSSRQARDDRFLARAALLDARLHVRSRTVARRKPPRPMRVVPVAHH